MSSQTCMAFFNGLDKWKPELKLGTIDKKMVKLLLGFICSVGDDDIETPWPYTMNTISVFNSIAFNLLARRCGFGTPSPRSVACVYSLCSTVYGTGDRPPRISFVITKAVTYSWMRKLFHDDIAEKILLFVYGERNVEKYVRNVAYKLTEFDDFEQTVMSVTGKTIDIDDFSSLYIKKTGKRLSKEDAALIIKIARSDSEIKVADLVKSISKKSTVIDAQAQIEYATANMRVFGVDMCP